MADLDAKKKAWTRTWTTHLIVPRFGVQIPSTRWLRSGGWDDAERVWRVTNSVGRDASLGVWHCGRAHSAVAKTRRLDPPISHLTDTGGNDVRWIRCVLLETGDWCKWRTRAGVGDLMTATDDVGRMNHLGWHSCTSGVSLILYRRQTALSTRPCSVTIAT